MNTGIGIIFESCDNHNSYLLIFLGSDLSDEAIAEEDNKEKHGGTEMLLVQATKNITFMHCL